MVRANDMMLRMILWIWLFGPHSLSLYESKQLNQDDLKQCFTNGSYRFYTACWLINDDNILFLGELSR